MKDWQKDWKVPKLTPRQTEAGTSVGIFYLSMLAFQRIVGMMSIHAGSPFPLTVLAGFGAVAMSSSITHIISPSLSNELSSSSHHTPRLKVGDVVRNSFVGMACYIALERNAFMTALPSSVLTTGVYARLAGSIRATSEVATQAQRRAVQRFGRMYGCHHCGYRPLADLTGRVKYIADHMPPTHRMHVERQKLWRRLTQFAKNGQRLYPQCNRCMGIQASAVSKNTHKIIYHAGFRSWHLAPGLAIGLTDVPGIKETVQPIVDSLIHIAEPVIGGLVDFINDNFR
jgi:hypothetical protein